MFNDDKSHVYILELYLKGYEELIIHSFSLLNSFQFWQQIITLNYQIRVAALLILGQNTLRYSHFPH